MPSVLSAQLLDVSIDSGPSSVHLPDRGPDREKVHPSVLPALALCQISVWTSSCLVPPNILLERQDCLALRT